MANSRRGVDYYAKLVAACIQEAVLDAQDAGNLIELADAKELTLKRGDETCDLEELRVLLKERVFLPSSLKLWARLAHS